MQKFRFKSRLLSFSQGWSIAIKTFSLNDSMQTKTSGGNLQYFPQAQPFQNFFFFFYQFSSNLSPQQCAVPLCLWLCVVRPQALREFCQRDRVQPDTGVVIKTRRNLLCHSLAVNQQAPQSPELDRGEFPRGSFIHELLHKVSLMLEIKTKIIDIYIYMYICWKLFGRQTTEGWTETSVLKHLRLWQLDIGDCAPSAIPNNAPLFYLHFPLLLLLVFSPHLLLLSPSLPHPRCPSNVSAAKEAERLSCSAAWCRLTHYAPVTSLQKQSRGCDKHQAN